MQKLILHPVLPAQSQNTESELLQKIAEGDTDAFRIIYEKYWNTIYATALSYLKSTAWAEDIVQDIFLKVWIKREKLPEIKKFDAYLFIMARNELLNAIESRMTPASIPEQYHDELPDDLLSPERILDLKQLDALVYEAAALLPPRQQLIFDLTRTKGLSHEHIAQQLGISERTVSNHITMALNNIRRYLQEHFGSF